MLLSFMEGFMLGLGAAVPLGPINILIMNEAIKKYKNGVMIGLGAMSSDIVYLLVITYGLAVYVNQPEILNLLSLFGGFFLIYLAYSTIKTKDEKIDFKIDKRVKREKSKLYLKGFFLTLVNPYTVGFWLSVSGYVTSKELNAYIMLLGMLSAILLWITIMPYFVHKSKHKISQKVSHVISILSSMILFTFGIVMIISIFM